MTITTRITKRSTPLSHILQVARDTSTQIAEQATMISAGQFSAECKPHYWI